MSTRPPLRVDTSQGPVLAALAGIFLLTAMDVSVKMLTESLTTTQIVVARYAVAATICAILFLATRQPWPDRGSVIANAARAAMMLATAWMFFFALGHAPLAEVFALAFTAPLFMALISGPLLGETVAPRVWAAIALGLAGAVVVLSGQIIGQAGRGEMIGYLAALGSAVTYALVMVLIRRRSAAEGFVSFVTQQNLYAAVLAALLLLLTGGSAPQVMAESSTLGLVLLTGLLGAAGQLALGFAYARAEAARLGATEYTGFIWGAAAAYILFAEIPAPATWAGTLLIISGAVLAARR
jgi:S-adenosylmethionine uptake transporter